jgi:Protein of unknown function (DUF3572)
MNSDQAEILALKALAFLAHSPEELDRFVSLSGLTPDDLRERAGEPETLAAVMDFLMAEDARVMGFCEEARIDPRELQNIRRALPGA